MNHTDAQKKAIHAKVGKKQQEYKGGPVKYNEKTDKYDTHCTYCDKSLGSFSGGDHAREAYENHKESH